MNAENFDHLSREKRQAVLNAGLSCFGKSGYKKTAVSEIALAAGISKASIFHYFKTKKGLYLYLYDFACKSILDEMTAGTKDFFECLTIGIQVKMRVMKKHPGMYGFLLSIVNEKNTGLIAELQKINNGEVERAIALLFENVDWNRFKPDYDRSMIINLMRWITEGCVKQFSETLSGEGIITEVQRHLEMMKKILYKEEYL